MKNICDWKQCKEVGEFKAPTEKDNSKKFKWLCLEHIKEFNKKWDYFKDMSEEEVRSFLKSDMTWHRPTQSFGSSDNFFNVLWKHALGDKTKFFDKLGDTANSWKQKISLKDKEAFKILGLKSGENWNEVQKKFKILVKKLHPDMNSGNKLYEEKLKKITLAYNHLKIFMKEQYNGKFK